MNAFTKKWKELAANRSFSSADMATYALSKAVHEAERTQQDPLELAKIYIKKSFKPVTKSIKLANGAYPYAALCDALFYVPRCDAFKEFESIWTPEHKEAITKLASSIRPGYRRINL